MTVFGHVENGKIVLDGSVPLTDGMRVRIELLDAAQGKTEDSGPQPNKTPDSFFERHKSWIGAVKDAPADYAKNHDQYLYGQPKK
jgi:hypothetical protein